MCQSTVYLSHDLQPFVYLNTTGIHTRKLQGYVKSQNIIFKNLFLVNLHMRHDRYGQNIFFFAMSMVNVVPFEHFNMVKLIPFECNYICHFGA